MNDALIIKTAPDYDATVIWLHGLGADGHDFEDIIPSLSLPENLKIKFIFPHAPVMPVTINNGASMRAWFDIRLMDLDRIPDVAGIQSSAASMRILVEKEISEGILPSRILLAGFSQGGVIAIELGLRFPQRLGGIIALSTYSPTTGELSSEGSEANKDLPIFWGHGVEDQVVPLSLAREVRDSLVKQNYAVDFHEYANLPHSVYMPEIKDIADFLKKVLL